MNKTRTGRIGILVASVIALAMFSLPGVATAKDRNRDRIPDRWEKQHKLSLKKDQRKFDQDRDGLRNRGEWLADTNPRDRDSDDDGTIDGNENAGVVTTYDAESGVLKITLYGGGAITGTVNDGTEIECADTAGLPEDEGEAEEESARGDSAGRGLSSGGSSSLYRGNGNGTEDDGTEDHGTEDDGTEDDGTEDDGTEDDDAGCTCEDESGYEDDDESGYEDDSEDHGEDCGESCSVDDLAPGVIVREAGVSYRGRGAVFTGLEIEQPVSVG